MNIHFENWLKEDSLYEYYVNADDEEKKQIFKDYQYDFFSKDPDGFVIWMINNPELVESEFPDFVKDHSRRISEQPTPFPIVNFVYDFPRSFSERIDEVNKLVLNASKISEINRYILLVTGWLDSKFTDLKYQSAIDTIRDSLVEELDYWRREYNKLVNPVLSDKPDSNDVILNVSDHYILDITKINAIFNLFNNIVFKNMNYADFLSCFNISRQPTHPDFIRGMQIKFVYFLVQINVNEKIALSRFGIRNFKTQKSRVLNENQPEPVFVNQIKTILKI